MRQQKNELKPCARDVAIAQIVAELDGKVSAELMGDAIAAVLNYFDRDQMSATRRRTQQGEER